jgi:hypothetical protein
LTKYLIYFIVFSMIGALTLLTSDSTFAQSNQSSQQQQAPPLPPPSVVPPMNNETSEGFGNVTDVQNLTGLNQAAMENQTGGGGQQQSNQTSNQTSNQSAAGGGQQQSNQTSNQTSNQSAAGGGQQQQQDNQSGSGPLEQIGQTINKMFGGK